MLDIKITTKNRNDKTLTKTISKFLVKPEKNIAKAQREHRYSFVFCCGHERCGVEQMLHVTNKGIPQRLNLILTECESKLFEISNRE